MDKKVIAVFGGSFNPPLNSHFSLADQIINEYDFIEKVIFVPVNSKYLKEDLLSNEDRYNMLKLVCDKNPGFLVEDYEINASRAVYTIETLTYLQEKYPDKSIWFIVGTDNFKEIYTWKKKEELVKNFKILVLERGIDSMDDIVEENEFLKEHKDSFIKVANNIRSNLSSTFVRDKIRRKKSIRYLIPEEIFDYIKEKKLFDMEK